MAVPIILFMLSNTDFKTTALKIYRRKHDKLSEQQPFLAIKSDRWTGLLGILVLAF
ncbi:hypothetical protein M0802_016167 [Mischocyttarus mexicanus]|nr:hypothetical protein M0802_016264 [Mischocyttarus mexicanus]KAI4473355.1 hypothetical protein M0802_016167 [Mischocyttarus mexicanus]